MKKTNMWADARFASQINAGTVEPLGTNTSLLRTVSIAPTKFSYIFFKKKKTLYNTDSL